VAVHDVPAPMMQVFDAPDTFSGFMPLNESPGGPWTLTNLPATINMQLQAGDSFAFELDVTDDVGDPWDLSECVVLAQIRPTASGNLAGAFTPSVTESGSLRLELPAAVSAALPRSAVWDVDVTEANGWVTTLAAGSITMTPEVSRPA